MTRWHRCDRLVRVATAKAERLLNLVIALLNAPTFRTAAWIRQKVAGYADAPTEEAFLRTFERDKKELRELGIPLQTPPNGADGYRIPRSRVRPARRCLSPRPRRRRWRWPAGCGRPPRWAPPGRGRCARSATPTADRPRHRRRDGPAARTPRGRRTVGGDAAAAAGAHVGPGVRADARRGAGSAGGRVRLPQGPAAGRPNPPAAAVGAGVVPRPVVRHRPRRGPRRPAHVPAVPDRRRGATGRPGGGGPAPRRASTCWPRWRPACERPATDRQATLRVRAGRGGRAAPTAPSHHPDRRTVRVGTGCGSRSARCGTPPGRSPAHGPDVVVEEPAGPGRRRRSRADRRSRQARPGPPDGVDASRPRSPKRR